jgi:membrane protease YdiL (CAAX protease family)
MMPFAPMPFALTLSPDLRLELLTTVEATFILFVLVSFVCVSAYTAKQLRRGRFFPPESAPLPLVIQEMPGWVFVVCVVGLIYLQSRLYAIVVMIGVAGAVLECGTTLRTQFGFDRVPVIKSLAWGLFVFGAVMLVETPLLEFSAWALDTLHISHPEQQSVETFRQYNQASAIILFLIQAVLVYPVVEELFFRGFLLTFLKRYTSTGLAIVLSAGLFAFAHLNLGAVLPLWFLGIALGVAYQHTGSLLVPISVHACFNLAEGLSLLLEKGNAS